MNRLETKASYETIYATLRKRILHLELLPGATVSETETAQEFSVSRTPVRDAFKSLINEGLLEVKPHIGTFVTLINMEHISDILYIREIMEKAVIGELSLSFNPSQEFKLKCILHDQENLIQNASLSSEKFATAFIKSDNDFHKMLFTLAGKQNLLNYFDAISAQYERFRTFLIYKDSLLAQNLYAQHLELLKLIKNKENQMLPGFINHHLYDGFNSKINLIYEYPDYFAPQS